MGYTVALGSDHAGRELKDKVGTWLESRGHTVDDLGTYTDESVDYPDYAYKVSAAVRDGKAERGVIVCGSGAGACIAANKVDGIRAAVCHDTYSAHQAVEHDDINVLCLGGRIVGDNLAEEIVDAWARAAFSGDERHIRRLEKVEQIAKGTLNPA